MYIIIIELELKKLVCVCSVVYMCVFFTLSIVVDRTSRKKNQQSNSKESEDTKIKSKLI